MIGFVERNNRGAKVMSLHVNHLEIDSLKEVIYEKIEYSYLNKYIQPSIDEYQLKTLAFILQATSLDKNEQIKYITSTMLVQIAADTHERVPIQNETDESEVERTNRQLTVLAGDYFSGLFYLALSQEEDIDFVHMLASTIRELNELKMKQHYEEARSLQEFMKLEQRIESLLLTRVAQYFNVPYFQQMVGILLFTYKLIKEKNFLKKYQQSAYLEKWNKFSEQFTKASVLRRLNEMIDDKIEHLKKESYVLPSSVYDRFHPLLDQLMVLHYNVMKER